MAKKVFETFKKRFNKKRNNLAGVSRSGTNTASVKRAQDQYDEYKFFHWYNEYQRPRQVTTNSTSKKRKVEKNKDIKDLLRGINTSDSEDADEIDGLDDDFSDLSPRIVSTRPIPTAEGIASENEDDKENKDDEEGAEKNSEGPGSVAGENTEKTTLTEKNGHKSQEKPAKPPKKLSKKEIEIKTDALIGDLAKSIKNRKSAPKAEKDGEDLFGATIALEVRKMPDRLKCMAKNEINQVLFKYQMSMFNSNDMQHTQLAISQQTFVNQPFQNQMSFQQQANAMNFQQTSNQMTFQPPSNQMTFQQMNPNQSNPTSEQLDPTPPVTPNTPRNQIRDMFYSSPSY